MTIEAALRTADRIAADEKVEGDYILEPDVLALAAEVRRLREEVAWQTAVNKELMKSQESLARDLIRCRESKK